jgi:endonuclease YncB( thermonuclease family)
MSLAAERAISDCNYNNTQPYFPEFTEGKVVKVHDGDTFHIVANINGVFYRFIVRMYGYDSPELNTDAGKRAKHALETRIMDKIVKVEIHKIREKYGRELATVSDDKGEINKWMIEQGYGIPYKGGTKPK